MPYCVKCGVKLDDFTPKCPLCMTDVINPDEPKEKADSPFPERVSIPEQKKRKYWAVIISVLLFLPSIVCFVVNLLLSPSTPWSAYVISTSVLLWILFAFPFMLKKKKPYLLIALDATAIAAYASVFFILVHSGEWFLELFVPLDILSLGVGLTLAKYFKKKHSRLHSIMAVLGAVTVFAGTTEAILQFTPHSIIFDCIAISIAATAFILFVLLSIADRNKHFKIWLTKNFYF
ncbi:MAG: hypothetical protein E7557_02070 [Ruminococcaceae bacterium]|nr:hypothetical protein [Oscillospiraceae bacterium]